MIDHPYYIVPEDAFDEMQLEAGVLLTEFDWEHPYAEPASANILAVTSGGLNCKCEPQYVDLAEDVDNVPNNTKEFLRVTGYNCTMGFDSLRFNPDNTAWAIGGATKYTANADLPTGAPSGTTKIVPRVNLDTTDGTGDFKDIYAVYPLADGGIYVVRMKNAISTGGLSIQSTKDGKGKASVELTGYISVKNVKEVPMEYYVIPPQATSTTSTPGTSNG